MTLADGRVGVAWTDNASIASLDNLDMPRVLDPVARRHGNAIRVTWRTAQPAIDTSFLLLTLPTSAPNVASAGVAGHGRTRFSATLHLSPGVNVHTVTLSVSTSESQRNDTLKVPVR